MGRARARGEARGRGRGRSKSRARARARARGRGHAHGQGHGQGRRRILRTEAREQGWRARVPTWTGGRRVTAAVCPLGRPGGGGPIASVPRHGEAGSWPLTRADIFCVRALN
jgi:hypothetical protein